MRFLAWALVILTAVAARAQQPDFTDGPRPMELLRKDAAQTLRHVRTESGQTFLIAASWLPLIEPRTVYYNKAAGEALTPDQWKVLDDEKKKDFKELVLTEQFYYQTKYGTPMAYARPLDLIVRASGYGKNDFWNGKHILDYGFGGIGHLRLLASLGATAAGVDVDPLLKAYYREAEDTGKIEGAFIGGQQGPPGNLFLHYGKFPAEADVKQGVESHGPYDIVISKNTLKKGYVTPEKPVRKELMVDLGVAPTEFLKIVFADMKPGGYFMIYNICPAQKSDAYIPWADGRCPFTQEMLKEAGFKVLDFDTDDSIMIREFAKGFEWDQGTNPMDVNNDLFATYTLLQRPAEAPRPPDAPAAK